MPRTNPLRTQLFPILLLVGLFIGINQTIETHENSSATEVLIRKVSAQLTDSGIKTVVVFELSGPDGQWLPFGGWLADEVSRNLSKGNERIEVIERSRIAAEIKKRRLTSASLVSPELRAEIAKALGADGFISGSFGPFKDQIGVTLAAWRSVGAKSTNNFQYVSMVTGKIPLDREATLHLTDSLESLRPADGVYKAGYAGRTVAECEYCPPPQLPAKTVWRIKHGTIVLAIVVLADGHTTNVRIDLSPDPELNAEAVKAVQTYRFKPAVDPDGEPVPVRMPYTLTFRITDGVRKK